MLLKLATSAGLRYSLNIAVMASTPLQAPTPSSTSEASGPPKRHRNRKPASERAAPTTAAEPGSSQPQQAQAAQPGPAARTEGHWRGGGARGSSFRGRGNGAGRGRGSVRGFSSAAERDAPHSAGEMEDLGRRLGGAGPRPATAPPIFGQPSSQRAFSTTSAPAFEAPRSQGPPVANQRRKKGKGKQDATESAQPTFDPNGPLLERVARKEGEEGGFNKEVERLYEVRDSVSLLQATPTDVCTTIGPTSLTRSPRCSSIPHRRAHCLLQPRALPLGPYAQLLR